MRRCVCACVRVCLCVHLLLLTQVFTTIIDGEATESHSRVENVTTRGKPVPSFMYRQVVLSSPGGGSLPTSVQEGRISLMIPYVVHDQRQTHLGALCPRASRSFCSSSRSSPFRRGHLLSATTTLRSGPETQAWTSCTGICENWTCVPTERSGTTIHFQSHV